MKDLSRRGLIVSMTALSCVSWRGQAFAARSVTEIAESLRGLAADPYIEATMTVLSGYGLIATSLFQAAVRSDLDAIKNKLVEIDRKVDTILSLVERLPDVIERKIEDNTKRQILSEVKSKREFVEGVVAKYLKGFGLDTENISDSDKSKIRDIGSDVLQRCFQLAGWGQDSHIGVAYAYQVYRYCTNLSGQSDVDQKYAMDHTIKIIKDGATSLWSSLNAISNSYDAEKNAINSIHRKIFLGNNDPRSARDPEFYYMDIGGDFTAEFSIAKLSVGSSFTNTFKAARVISPYLSDFPLIHDRSQTKMAAEKLIKRLNEAVSSIHEKYDSKIMQIKNLILSAESLAEATENSYS